jgi:deoxyribodipyrimidine photo-lyase
LLWRDYFRNIAAKFGKKIFLKNGIKHQTNKKKFDPEIFKKWTLGETGEDFVDANMKELLQTGWMSNRGRQNVASYWIHDLNMDWRPAAAWFEQQLIDYDVYSNYGNWIYLAGVGNDPRPNRKFNIQKQAEQYDQQGEYMNKWLKK